MYLHQDRKSKQDQSQSAQLLRSMALAHSHAQRPTASVWTASNNRQQLMLQLLQALLQQLLPFRLFRLLAKKSRHSCRY